MVMMQECLIKEPETFNYDYEIYYLLIKDGNNFRKVEFETQNTLAQVNFDYKKVYEYEDNPNVEVVGFFHTHPRGANYMSVTDVNSMKAWTKC